MNHNQFIGRSPQLEHLQNAFDEVLNGNGKIVLVSGEAGIGKTSLVQQFQTTVIKSYNQLVLEEAKENKNLANFISGVFRKQERQRPYAIWLDTRCSGRGNKIPYEPLRDILDQLVSINTKKRSVNFKKAAPILAKISKHALSTTMPSLVADIVESIVSDAVEHILDLLGLLQGEGENESGVEDVRLRCNNIFRIITKKSVLILFFDDLHWSDESFSNFLFYMARNTIHRLPILIIGTYRPEDIIITDTRDEHPLNRLIGDMMLESCVSKIEPDRFDRNSVQTYLNRLYSPNNFEPKVIDFLAKASDGSPLFLTHLMSLFISQKNIVQDQGSWRLKDNASLEDIPPVVEEIITKRLSLLKGTPNEISKSRRFLDYASLQGNTFNSWLLMNLLPAEDVLEDVEDRLELIEQVHQIIEQLEIVGFIKDVGTDYGFSHSFIQKVIYNELPIGKKRNLHRKLGELLESWAHENNKLKLIAPIIAEHFERGENIEKAIEYMLISAREAAQVVAMPECRADCKRILKTLEKLPKQAAQTEKFQGIRVETLLLLGRSKEFMGEWPEAMAIYEEAEQLIINDDHQIFSCLIHQHIGVLLLKQSKFEEAIKHLQLSFKKAHELDLQREMALVLKDLGKTYMYYGDWDKSLSAFNYGLGIARKANDDHLLASLYSLTGEMMYRYGKMDEALKYNGLALDLARKLNNRIALAHNSSRSAYIHILLGNWENGRAYLDSAAEIIEDYGDEYGKSDLMQGNFVYYFGQGNYQQALKILQSYYEHSKGLRNNDGISFALRWKGHIRLYQSKADEAIENIEAGLSLLPSSVRDLVGDLGVAMILKGEIAQAIQYINQKIEVATQMNAIVYIGILCLRAAQAYLKENNLVQAKAYANKALDNLEKTRRYYLPEAYLLLTRILLAEDSFSEAELYLSKARDVSKSMGLVFRLNECDIVEIEIDLKKGLPLQSIDNILTKIQEILVYFRNNDFGLLVHETQNTLDNLKFQLDKR